MVYIYTRNPRPGSFMDSMLSKCYPSHMYTLNISRHLFFMYVTIIAGNNLFMFVLYFHVVFSCMDLICATSNVLVVAINKANIT